MNIKKFIIFSISIILIDSIWLKTVMVKKYTSWFSKLNIKMTPKYLPIILAYITMIICYPLFIENKNKKKELINAIFIGAIIYGLYGFTISGIFPHYNLNFALLELCWGIILFTLGTIITQFISSKIIK